MNLIQDLQARIDRNRQAVNRLLVAIHSGEYTQADNAAMRPAIDALNEAYLIMTGQRR